MLRYIDQHKEVTGFATISGKIALASKLELLPCGQPRRYLDPQRLGLVNQSQAITVLAALYHDKASAIAMGALCTEESPTGNLALSFASGALGLAHSGFCAFGLASAAVDLAIDLDQALGSSCNLLQADAERIA
jgi:hypothetical protein